MAGILPRAGRASQPFAFLYTALTKHIQSKRSFFARLERAFHVDAGEVVATAGKAAVVLLY